MLTLLLIISIVALIGAFKSGFIVPTYKVLYNPIDSRNQHRPIQSYTIVGNPRNRAWKSSAGNTLFTALSARNFEKFIAFRSERVLSVNFAGFTVLTPKARKYVKSTWRNSGHVASAA